MQYQSQALPHAHDRIEDPTTINHGLPQQNDVRPSINPPPNLSPQQLDQLVAEFRYTVQIKSNQSPLHTFQYNLLSSNRFQNQYFSQYVQMAADFAEFLLVVRNYNQQSVGKAVEMITKVMSAQIVQTFPSLGNFLPQAYHQEIQQMLEQAQHILTDIQQFQANGRRPMQQAYAQPMQQGYQQPMPQQAMPQQGYQQPGMPIQQQGRPVSIHGQQYYNGQQAMPGAPAPIQAGPMVQQHAAPTASGGARAGKYMDDTPPPAHQGPAPGTGQSWQPDPQQPSTHTPLTTFKIQPQGETVSDASQYRQPGQSAPAPTTVMETTDKTAPVSIDDVLLDPDYYQVPGVEYNPQRPYDLIHNPGGVEIRPALLSGWKRTVNESNPYAMGYDPQLFIMFHVRWPDGVVEELLSEITDDMKYLQHEINAELRGKYTDPNGKVVLNTRNLVNMGDGDRGSVSLDDILEDTKDDERPDIPAKIVTVDGLFSASTEMENEEEAFKHLTESLQLADDQPVPTYEYVSAKVSPLKLEEEGHQRLIMLSESDSLPNLAYGLQEALNDGVLPKRYFRFLNDRFTTMVNSALADNLSVPDIYVDDFVEDIDDLYTMLRNGGDEAIVELMQDNTEGLLRRWFSVEYEEEDSGILCLLDESINIQMSWSDEEVNALSMTEEPVLISKSTHPSLYGLIYATLERRIKEKSMGGRRMRLITADGTYLEAIKGWLVDGAVLVKKLS